MLTATQERLLEALQTAALAGKVHPSAVSLTRIEFERPGTIAKASLKRLEEVIRSVLADAEADTPEAATKLAGEPARGRGAPRRASAPKASRKATGRTVYIPDDLWERIIVQAHRRKVTISDYVTAILNRQVPDHRTIRGADDSAFAASSPMMAA